MALQSRSRSSGLSAVDRELYFASIFGSLSDIQATIQKGANACCQHSSGYTPLIWLARAGRLDELCFLLPLSNPLSSDDLGNTALHWAAKNGHADCLFHLASVASVQALNHNHQTALQVAQAHQAGDCVAILEHFLLHHALGACRPASIPGFL